MALIRVIVIGLFLCNLNIAKSHFLKLRNCEYVESVPAIIVFTTRIIKSFTTDSLRKCISLGCVCNPRCAGSYEARNKRCLITHLNTMSSDWSMRRYFVTDKYGSSKSFLSVTALVSLKLPDALFPLDHFVRFKNIGSNDILRMNERVEMSDISQDLSYQKPGFGPLHPTTQLEYPTFHQRDQTILWNKIHVNESIQIEFDKAFTVMMWVKARPDDDQMMPLLDGYHKEESGGTLAAHFWLLRRYKTIAFLCHTQKKYALTQYVDSDSLDWNHVAWTYDGSNKYHSYINGKLVPFAKIGPPFLDKSVNPTYFKVGRRNNANPFKGRMACIMLFSRYLNEMEISTYRQSCP